MIFARSLNDATFTRGTNACLCPCYHGKNTNSIVNMQITCG